MFLIYEELEPEEPTKLYIPNIGRIMEITSVATTTPMITVIIGVIMSVIRCVDSSV